MEKVNELVVLNGGVDVKVSHTEGTSEDVKVRQLPIRQMDRWAELAGNEPALVELYCGKPEGWADTLVNEDYEMIVDLGDQLNRPIFDRWIARVQAGTGRFLETAGRIAGEAAKVKAEASRFGVPFPARRSSQGRHRATSSIR